MSEDDRRSIPLFYPQRFKEEWITALGEVFDTRWIGQGPKVEEFEKAFGNKFNYEHCLALNSGSSALELAYHLLEIGKDDDVITTVFTCTATNIPLLRRGANIIFADINDDFTISFDDVKRKLTPKTKAIVAVTLGGLPVDERLFTLGVPVVVDAAQSLGVSEARGDYICYSFQAIKHFTTGDGGMLVLRDEAIYRRAKKLRWFGIDREAKKRVNFQCLNNREITMEIEEAGYKFHMNDIAAAMGLVGLKHSDELIERRKEVCKKYSSVMTGVYGGSYWLFLITATNRDELIEYFRENGVECDMVQLRNDIFKVFGGRRQNLPNMDRLEKLYSYLPLHCDLSNDDVQYVVEVLKNRPL